MTAAEYRAATATATSSTLELATGYSGWVPVTAQPVRADDRDLAAGRVWIRHERGGGAWARLDSLRLPR